MILGEQENFVVCTLGVWQRKTGSVEKAYEFSFLGYNQAENYEYAFVPELKAFYLKTKNHFSYAQSILVYLPSGATFRLDAKVGENGLAVMLQDEEANFWYPDFLLDTKDEDYFDFSQPVSAEEMTYHDTEEDDDVIEPLVLTVFDSKTGETIVQTKLIPGDLTGCSFRDVDIRRDACDYLKSIGVENIKVSRDTYEYLKGIGQDVHWAEGEQEDT